MFNFYLYGSVFEFLWGDKQVRQIEINFAAQRILIFEAKSLKIITEVRLIDILVFKWLNCLGQ